MWKLACLERAFPAAFPPGGARALCAERALDELRLRYEREHNRAQRPVLRRITEGDTPPGVPMCLVVCGIRAVAHKPPQRQPSGIENACAAAGGASDSGGPLMFELELTDGAQTRVAMADHACSAHRLSLTRPSLCPGWYPIRARIDAALTAAVRADKLRVGDKLFVSAATKEGADMPAPPLEAYSSVWLALGINGATHLPHFTRVDAG